MAGLGTARSAAVGTALSRIAQLAPAPAGPSLPYALVTDRLVRLVAAPEVDRAVEAVLGGPAAPPSAGSPSPGGPGPTALPSIRGAGPRPGDAPPWAGGAQITAVADRWPTATRAGGSRPLPGRDTAAAEDGSPPPGSRPAAGAAPTGTRANAAGSTGPAGRPGQLRMPAGGVAPLRVVPDAEFGHRVGTLLAQAGSAADARDHGTRHGTPGGPVPESARSRPASAVGFDPPRPRRQLRSDPGQPVPSAAPAPGAAVVPVESGPVTTGSPVTAGPAPTGLAGLVSWWETSHPGADPGGSAPWSEAERTRPSLPTGPAGQSEQQSLGWDRSPDRTVLTADPLAAFREALEQVLIDEALAEGLEVGDGAV